MNTLPELVRADAGDWLFIVFVLFGIAAQAIDGNRKKKLAAKKAAEWKGAEPPVPPKAESTPNVPQADLNAFLQALGMGQQQAPSPTPSLRPSSVVQANPVPVKKPVPVPQKTRIRTDLKPHYDDAVSEEEPEPCGMPDNKGANLMRQSSALVMNMQGIKMPTIQLGPRMTASRTPKASFNLNLKDRNELRRAILNQEILGKPKAMETQR